MEAAFGIIGLVAQGVSGFLSRKEEKKGRKEQRAARELAERREQVEERRRRRREIRQKRIAAGQVVNNAASVGALGSSGPAGGLSSLSSQLGTSQGYASHISGLNQGITARTDAAQRHFDRAGNISAFGNFAGQAIPAIGGLVSGFNFGGGFGGSSTYRGNPSNPTSAGYV